MATDASEPSTDASQPATARPATLSELFFALTWLALRGFGGVLPWAQRVLVEERRWLTREQFVDMLAFGQLLPGPNVCNLALMVGDRFFGWRGAIVALLGMLTAPALLVLSMIAVYAQFSANPVVRQMMAGMSAVAAGLILATGVKLALALRRRWQWLGFGVAAFVLVGVLRVPLVITLIAVVPLAVALAWRAERR